MTKKAGVKPPLRRTRQGDEINRVVDRALVEPSNRALQAVAAVSASQETVKMAERVRRRASRLCRENPAIGQQILRARDRLIFLIYGKALPGGACSAWCDASLKQSNDDVVAVISGLLFSPQGKLLSRISHFIEERDAVKAEATAVAAVMQAALRSGAERLRAHSDCVALVRLWLERRDDPRLETIRQLAAQFHWFELCRVPRLHNQPADRLAKRTLEKHFRSGRTASGGSRPVLQP